MSEHEKRVNAVTTAVGNVILTWTLFEIERVVLFGSSARGDFGAESDIDLLLVYPDRDYEVVKASQKNFAHDVRSQMGSSLAPVSVTHVRSTRWKDPNLFSRDSSMRDIVEAAIKEGIVLYEYPSGAV